MSDNNNSDVPLRNLNYQRRSVSVGDSPFLAAVDDQYDTQDNERTISDEQYLKPGDFNDRICTPLPRTNHRPTASTCWLVFHCLFSSVLNPFPIDNINNNNNRIANPSADHCHLKICFFIIDKRKQTIYLALI